MEEQKRQREEFMSFGPALFHRVMRRVGNGDQQSIRLRRKASLEAEAQAMGQQAPAEVAEKSEAEQKVQQEEAKGSQATAA